MKNVGVACAGCVLMALTAGKSYAVDDLARLERLIAIPSVSSNIVEVNRAVDFLDGELGRDGLWRRIETMNDGRRVLFAANVATNRPDVLLSAHLDVVPALLPEQYRARRENGRIYGRGASDCKEHVILCARLMRGLKGRVSVGVIFGSDEEIGGMSTTFMLDRGYGASKMVVVLDSEQFAITTRQKGLARYVIEAHAPAVHTGMYKDAPPNAVRDLIRGFESAAAEIPDREDGTWRDILMLERVSGTRTQAEIEISIRCATPGGWGRIEDMLREKFGRDLRCIRKGDPVMLDESQPYLIDFLARMRHRWPDRNVGFYHLNSSTDARHLQRLNLPMLILGVDARGAHTASEYVEIASLDEYADLIGGYLAETYYCKDAVASAFELAKDGTARAAIVIPANPNGVEKFAVEELKYHLDKMFAADFKVVGEDDLETADVTSKIFLGATKAAAEAGIPGKPFDEEEHVVRTVGTDLFLVGADGGLSYEDIGNFDKCRQCGTLYAVYDFLENELGVKWIWPGELGEVIERRRSFFMPPTDRRSGEPLVSRKWYGTVGSKGTPRGFSSAEARSRFYAAQRKFLCRHRYGHRREIASGHSFGNWWKRFGKEHPEYFNLLSTGERKPLYNNARGVTMCVSEPGVWRQKVADWRKNLPSIRKAANSPNARFEWINCCENDYAGLCTCAKCRSWDAPDPRFALNDYWSGKADKAYLAALLKVEGAYGLDRVCGDERWVLPKTNPATRNAASLSDRYAKFYNAVLTEARKFESGARVIGYAYDNYLEAPKQTRVDGAVVIEFVPRSYFPYDKTESDFFRKHWMGWRAAGVRDFVLRPNYMLAGGNYPIDNGRMILGDLAFAYTNGMIACGFDSLRGSWACHLMMDYALTRAFRDPLRGYDKAREDVLSAFGSAAKVVARYFDRVEAFTASWTEEKVREAALKNIVGGRTPGGSFPYPAAILGEFYDDGFFPEMQGILESAIDAAGGNATVVKRIEYLRKGLKDAELTRNCRIAQKKYDAEKSESAKQSWYGSFRELAAYRKSIEGDFTCALDKEANSEARMGWPHDKLGKEYEVW